MVTSAQWKDLDGNGFDDLVVAGNWMGIRIFMNSKGTFRPDNQLENFRGWWSSLAVEDSVWVDARGRPLASQQLVVTGASPAGGPNVSWRFHRAK